MTLDNKDALRCDFLNNLLVFAFIFYKIFVNIYSLHKQANAQSLEYLFVI